MTSSWTTLGWWLFGASLAALLYAHVVYPLLMALYSLRRSEPKLAPSDWPLVSLIIPAHNESMVIDKKIANSLAIDYPSGALEIIVVNDGSTDGTGEQAHAYDSSQLKVIDVRPRRGKSSAINEAACVAQGDFFCLCDANVMFEKSAVRQLVQHFSDEQVGAVTGDVRLASDESSFGAGESVYYKIERRVQLGESKLSSTICVDGGMFAIRKELFRPLPPDTMLDDLTTTINVLRQGYRVLYEPSAIAFENGTPTAACEFRRRSRLMEGAVQALRRRLWPRYDQPLLLWQFGSHKLLRWISPFCLIIALASSLMLSGHSRLAMGATCLQLGLYGTALLATAIEPLRRVPFFSVAFYFVLSHVAMLKGCAKALRSRPSGVWERTQRSSLETVSGNPLSDELSASSRRAYR